MRRSGFLFFMVSLLFFSLNAFSQDEIPETIITAIKSGNASDLAKNFNSNVELTLIDKENVYSKSQAEIILKDFFAKNPPTGFSIIHKGGKEGAKYAIGNLTTDKATYRVYFLIKSQNNKQLIHQLRIEQGDE